MSYVKYKVILTACHFFNWFLNLCHYRIVYNVIDFVYFCISLK